MRNFDCICFLNCIKHHSIVEIFWIAVEKRVDVSPAGSESASISSDGTSDEEVANIHSGSLADNENQESNG